jgi:hypothetical protein
MTWADDGYLSAQDFVARLLKEDLLREQNRSNPTLNTKDSKMNKNTNTQNVTGAVEALLETAAAENLTVPNQTTAEDVTVIEQGDGKTAIFISDDADENVNEEAPMPSKFQLMKLRAKRIVTEKSFIIASVATVVVGAVIMAAVKAQPTPEDEYDENAVQPNDDEIVIEA